MVFYRMVIMSFFFITLPVHFSFYQLPSLFPVSAFFVNIVYQSLSALFSSISVFFNTFLILPSSHRLNPFPLPQLFSSSHFLSFLQSPFPLHRRHRGFPPSFSTYAFTFSANFLLLRFLGRPQSRLHDSHPRKTLRLLRVLRLYEVLHAKTTWRFEPSGLSCLKKKAFITHDFAFYVC